MATVCLYLHAHQPWRIKKYSVFDIGTKESYFDDEKNRDLLVRIAKKSYLPTNQLLLDLIAETGGQFKISFSLTGTLLEQLERYAPAVIVSFQDLVDTGNVELLSETYYHSLAYLYSKDEFKEQVNKHQQKLKELFGVKPTSFRNTELMFNNEMAKDVQAMKFTAVLAEGADQTLGWRSPNFMYQAKGANKIKLLLRNYRLSDDIAFRFTNSPWKSWQQTTDKIVQWINETNGSGEVVNLFMDYETFGEHHWADSGIFEFLRAFPHKILEHPDNNFKTPSELTHDLDVKDELNVEQTTAWADTDRDMSAWLGNDMQRKAVDYIYELKDAVLASQDEQLIEDWRKLQTSDHFYYMCTKHFADGDVHKYFNPYDTPYDCFISYMNIINDLKFRLADKSSVTNRIIKKGRKISSQIKFVNQYTQLYEK